MEFKIKSSSLRILMTKICILLCILTFLVSNTYLQPIYSQSNQNENSRSIKYEAFLEILSNEDFIEGSYPGSGTEVDPYRIENLNIETSYSYGINIKNISK